MNDFATGSLRTNREPHYQISFGTDDSNETKVKEVFFDGKGSALSKQKLSMGPLAAARLITFLRLQVH